MNYSTAFTIAARTEAAYNAAQAWIRNDAPIIEAQIKRQAIKAFITICTFYIAACDWLLTELGKRDEYALRIQLATVKGRRVIVRRRIAFHSFIEYNGLNTKSAQLAARSKALWVRKGAIARQLADKVFCLN